MKDNIDVLHGTTEAGEHTTVVQDRPAGRAWTGIGKTSNEASTEAMKKFLGDRRTKEYWGDR